MQLDHSAFRDRLSTMYRWRFFIAAALGLVWYFSDCGRAFTQYLLCVAFCVCTPLFFGNSGRFESGTQTEEEATKHPLQDSDEEEALDRHDGGTPVKSEPLESRYPHVKKSLQQVFECAYAQLVLPWYEVPEPCELQPLHQVISREIDFVIDRIIEKAKDFDVCQAVVGSIRIFTQHLHNARQSDREVLFSSRADEVALLRELSNAVVQNLFSRTLLEQDFSRCALNEIIALKGLGLLVNWLSDPDNLNQLVVTQLDSVSLKGSPKKRHGSDSDQTSLTSQDTEGEEEGSEVSSSGETLPNGSAMKDKKVNRLKMGWSKFVDKVKSKKAKKKKMKRVEQDLVLRLMVLQGEVSNEDDVSSVESSAVGQEDSDRDDSDLDEYLASVQEDLIEFKLSYEMWRVGNWTVTIPHVDYEGEELIFTVHLEEKDSPENLHWDIKKTYLDVVHFRNRWQDSSNIPEVLVLGECEVNNQIKEEARASVERFLQGLISDDLIGHTQPVFQFLCPLDKLLNEEVQYGGVWGLLSGLAYFLTPAQEEEENSSPQAEVQIENHAPPPPSESTTLSVDDHSSSAQNGSVASPIPSIVVSQFDSPKVPVEPRGEEDAKAAVTPDHSHNCISQDKAEDSEHTFTSHLKMIVKGLTKSRSQESLSSMRSAIEGEAQDVETQHENTETPSWISFTAKSNKKDKSASKMCAAVNKMKGKETQASPLRGDDLHCQRGQVNWEQLEATKAIFELLKEISGNSILINIFDAILKPVMPILKKKVNSFLDKMNPTEEQMAAYIDNLCIKLWPEVQAAAPPPRTREDQDESKARAHDLINAKYTNFIVLKKTDVESVFNLFQDCDENKALVYKLLSFLLREFLHTDAFLNVNSAVLQKLLTASY